MTFPKIDKKSFRQKVEHLKGFPTLPHLMMKFTKMAKDPHTSMAAFGEEVSKDQTLTSKLLRLVNSAFYGFPGRIGTVTQALVLLGIDALKGLIVTSSVFDHLTPEAFPLWRHSLMTSLASRHIARMLHLADEEEIAVAGLLHDIGKIVLILEAPNEYRMLLKQSIEEKMPLFQVEKKYLGFDHAEIGTWLCSKWTLPEKLLIPIGFHHTPEQTDKLKLQTDIISAANVIVKLIGISAEANLPVLPPSQSIFQTINITKEQLKILVEKILPEYEIIRNIGPGDLK